MFGLMLIGMALETLGIGLVIPALALMTHGELAAKYPAIVPWLNALGNPSHERLVIIGMLTLVGVYAVKSLFLVFLAWQLASFVFELQGSLSQRLFIGYLRQPYVFHLLRNSAELIRNTMSQVTGYTIVIQDTLLLLADGLVLLGISVLLITMEPLGALMIASTLGLASWGFNHLTRERLLRWGVAAQLHDGLRIQHLQQGLGAAKDVKLLGRENEFLAQYQLHNAGAAHVGQRRSTLQSLPRLWLELIAVTGLAVLVLVMIGQGKPLEALLPTLGLFAAAAFRVLPSVNRVLGSVQNLRFSLPVIDTLHRELRLLEATKVPQRGRPLPFKNALAIDQLRFRYPNADAEALRGVSLTIARGASVGFVGGSGAGKSTLVDIILGLLTPSSGSVRVDGIDIQTNLRGWADQLGYVPQFIFLTDDTLRRNVAFGLSNEQIDEGAVRRAIRAAQLEQFVKELPQGLDSMVGERGVRLSGGQRQRIGIARALYHDPPVLVLDEATSSLDTTTESGVMEAVKALQGDRTILIVAHRFSTVEHCDRLFRLEQGQIIQAGTFAQVTAAAEVIST